MLFESWLAENNHLPVGSIAKLRGVLPPLGTHSGDFKVPLSGSMLNTAMLSCPRFETYRNLPFASITISAAVFLPAKSFGRVGIVCILSRVPGPGLYAKTVTVDTSSFTTYTNFLDGATATCRGPAPGSTLTNFGLPGVRDPTESLNRYTSNLSSPWSATTANRLSLATWMA